MPLGMAFDTKPINLKWFCIITVVSLRFAGDATLLTKSRPYQRSRFYCSLNRPVGTLSFPMVAHIVIMSFLHGNLTFLTFVVF